jgi:thiamine biosynthesis protein ThiS
VTILLNGEAYSTSTTTLPGLVEELGLPPPTLLIELNGEALRRNEWSERAIAEGDRIEILRIAAGG